MVASSAGTVALPGSGTARPARARAGLGPELLLPFLSILSLILLWYALALVLPSTALPMPHVVLLALVENLQGEAIWQNIALTLGRIALAFLVAMGVAAPLGFAMGLSRHAAQFFRVWIVCGLSIPALVVILTCYMVVGLNDWAAVLGAALPIIPILAINIREGVKGIDLRLLSMAKAFRASRGQRILGVIVPQIAPMLLASTRFGLGLVWKMVLFAEVLGRGDGIGYQIEFYYQMFNMTQVLAHALSFLIVMLLIEVGLLGLLERRIFRWRDG